MDQFDDSIPVDAGHFRGVTGDTKLGQDIQRNTGHSVWTDGRVHHAGMTVTFVPNTRVQFEHEGIEFDIDFNSQQEGLDLLNPTYASVTSRSWHPGGVNMSRLDGSVNFVTSNVNLSVWRAMGSISGGEVESVAY